MTQENVSFPEYFAATPVPTGTSLEATLDAMTYDVAAVVEDGKVVGTITSTQIAHNLRQGNNKPSDNIEDLMEPYQALGDYSEDLGDQMREIFYIFVFTIVRRQVDHKVFDPNNRDGFVNTVFSHIRRQLNNGKYEACRQRMTLSHWMRTVANNKIIDELRKLPSAETVESFRDRQRDLGHLSAVNPVKTANQNDVMEIIHEAIGQLPDKQRMALMQSMKTPDKPGAEVAEMLGMTLNAYHLNLNRARDKVQKILTEQAPETVHTVKNLRNKPRKDQ